MSIGLRTIWREGWKKEGRRTYGDRSDPAVLEREVYREVLVEAAPTRKRLADLERCGLERHLAANDAHEVADDDHPAVAQLRDHVRPIARDVDCEGSDASERTSKNRP